MSKSAAMLDIALLGGGISGLWLLNHFSRLGYHCALFGFTPIGGAQTLASQGMIHGGTKYALDGVGGESARVLAAMPDLWNACLAGKGPVDLGRTRCLSPHLHLWTGGGISGALERLLASRLFRSRVIPVSPDQYPEVFRHPGFSGELHRLLEPVLDMPSLVANLAGNYPQRIFGIDPGQLRIQLVEHSGEVRLDTPRETLHARRLLLCAGAGNEELLGQLGVTDHPMQRRPLRQVIVKHASLTPLYGHWLEASRAPRLTISSHAASSGQWVWYLGGELAEQGAQLEEPECLDLAARELAQLFPWLDLAGADWASRIVDRAEPARPQGGKPDGVYCEPIWRGSPVLVTWPTKLSLAPALAQRAQSLMIEPRKNRGFLPDGQHYPWRFGDTPWGIEGRVEGGL